MDVGVRSPIIYFEKRTVLEKVKWRSGGSDSHVLQICQSAEWTDLQQSYFPQSSPWTLKLSHVHAKISPTPLIKLNGKTTNEQLLCTAFRKLVHQY